MELLKEFFEIIFILLVTIGIFILAYVSTRFLAKKTMAKSMNKNMQVVEKLYLGKDKEAALIKIGNEYFIAGISQNSIQFNGPLSDDVKNGLVFEDASQKNNNAISEAYFSSYRMQALTVRLSSFIKNTIGNLRGNPDENKNQKR